MTRLFRGMKEVTGKLPEIGPSARTLGIRPGVDVPTTNPSDRVLPDQGGLSVSPGDPLALPYYRRPPELQGAGKDPVWEITRAELGPDLMYRPDPAHPDHGFVEPAWPMTLDEFQHALAQTQGRWRKVESWPTMGSASDAG